MGDVEDGVVMILWKLSAGVERDGWGRVIRRRLQVMEVVKWSWKWED